MRTSLSIIALLAALPGFARASSQAPRASGLPLFFVENRGQAPAEVRYMLKRSEVSAVFLDRRIDLTMRGQVVSIGLLNPAGPRAIEGIEAQPGRANFIQGNDRSAWVTDLPLSGAVAYREVWSGIDMIYGGNGRSLKSEFVVAAGADPSMIRWNYGSHMRAEVLADGSLSVTGQGLELREEPPVLYQDVRGERKAVSGAFRVDADGSVGFTVGAYNKGEMLVIDPVITYSTFIGGSGQDEVTALALEPGGDAIVAGFAASTNLAQNGPAKMRANAGGVDAFVAKFHDLGDSVLYCTYIGGSGDDRALAIALDAQSNVYLTGYTTSQNFPVTALAFQKKLLGSRDAFVLKLNAAGNGLLYSSYLGGTGTDNGNAIAVNSSGVAFVAGDTNSSDFPAVAALQSKNHGGYDGFLAAINAAGTAVSMSTYFGGSIDDHIKAMAIGPNGNIYLAGSTTSPDFPVQNALQSVSGGNEDAFIAEFNSAGSALVFSTYLGGSGGTLGMPEEAGGIAIDSSNNIIVAGTTSSTNFPVTANAAQGSYAGGMSDGFVVKLDPTGRTMLTSTYIGGSSLDQVTGVAVDPAGYILVVGYTASTDFPNIRSVQSGNKGNHDGFLYKLNPVKYTVVYATYLGGAGADAITAVAADKMGNAIVAGYTASGDFPIHDKIAPAQRYNYGPTNGFVTKISSGWSPIVTTSSSTRSWVPDFADNLESNGLWKQFTFGLPGDVPIVGDWDGSGVMRIGVFRNGVWMLDLNGNGVWDGPTGGDRQVSFGIAGDVPLLGDWNGSGTLKAGIFRHGYWILDLSGVLQGTNNNQAPKTFYYGLGTDIPVVGDWTGNGVTKVGAYRNGQWFLDSTGDYVWTGADIMVTFGPGTPVVGDWDGSGIAKPGYFSNGKWVLSMDQTYSGYSGTSTAQLTFYYGSSASTPLIGN